MSNLTSSFTIKSNLSLGEPENTSSEISSFFNSISKAGAKFSDGTHNLYSNYSGIDGNDRDIGIKNKAKDIALETHRGEIVQNLCSPYDEEHREKLIQLEDEMRSQHAKIGMPFVEGDASWRVDILQKVGGFLPTAYGKIIPSLAPRQKVAAVAQLAMLLSNSDIFLGEKVRYRLFSLLLEGLNDPILIVKRASWRAIECLKNSAASITASTVDSAAAAATTSTGCSASASASGPIERPIETMVRYDEIYTALGDIFPIVKSVENDCKCRMTNIRPLSVSSWESIVLSLSDQFTDGVLAALSSVGIPLKAKIGTNRKDADETGKFIITLINI